MFPAARRLVLDIKLRAARFKCLIIEGALITHITYYLVNEELVNYSRRVPHITGEAVFARGPELGLVIFWII